MKSTTMDQRGRNADSPKEIPAKGWKDTLLRVKKAISDDRVSMVSASMAYYALLALVPLITSIVLIYAWVSDPADINQHFTKISGVLPKNMVEILSSQLKSLSQTASSSLGIGAIVTLLFSLWSSSKGSKALMDAMNIIYDEKSKRGFIKSNAMALGLTFFGAVLSVIAIGVIVGIPAFFSQFHLPGLVETGIALGSWVILLGLFSVFLAAAYRFGPDRDEAKWRWVSWGACFSAILWAGASLLFSWYATKFGDFNKTYGSLGAVIVLMMWFYISSFTILIGAELNAELEHQTKKDTTVGPEQPMGRRGAMMADTLGEPMGEKKYSLHKHEKPNDADQLH